jgi:SAM-dependent methyltransferase
MGLPIGDDQREFFTGIVCECWRRAVPAEATDAEVAFLVDACRIVRGTRVLDVPCGHGRHAIRLAARGAQVTGVDFAEEELAILREDARARGVSVTTCARDMRELDGLGPFDVALCLGNSYGYADAEARARFLRALAGVVRDGGKLVIDLGTTAESLLPELQPKLAIDIGDLLLEIENQYDCRRSQLIGTFRFIERGTNPPRVTEKRFVHWVITTRELVDELECSGFDVEHLFADTARSPFVLGAQRLLLVARREG